MGPAPTTDFFPATSTSEYSPPGGRCFAAVMPPLCRRFTAVSPQFFFSSFFSFHSLIFFSILFIEPSPSMVATISAIPIAKSGAPGTDLRLCPPFTKTRICDRAMTQGGHSSISNKPTRENGYLLLSASPCAQKVKAPSQQ
jgi:hypothetical protein